MNLCTQAVKNITPKFSLHKTTISQQTGLSFCTWRVKASQPKVMMIISIACAIHDVDSCLILIKENSCLMWLKEPTHLASTLQQEKKNTPLTVYYSSSINLSTSPTQLHPKQMFILCYFSILTDSFAQCWLAEGWSNGVDKSPFKKQDTYVIWESWRLRVFLSLSNPLDSMR